MRESIVARATPDRTTKYVTAVRRALEKRGHATNADLLAMLQVEYPAVSATTVHRVTARLLDAGEVRLAPSGNDHAMRFDVNNQPHDHFMCTTCGLLRDTQLGPSIRAEIEQSIADGCSISGDLVVSGVCKRCKERGDR